MDKTIVMAIWIKQFNGDMDKTIVMGYEMDKTIL